MKKFGIGILTTGILISSFSANAETVSNNAAVVIIEPLVVTANNDMNFGTITKPATTGTVVLTSGGSISTTTGGISTTGGTPAAGTVTISGDSTQTVNVTVTDTTSEAGLTLSDFTSASFGGQSLSSNALTGATLTGGNDVLTIGATLTVDSTAAGFTTGNKTPTYDVEVLYD